MAVAWEGTKNQQTGVRGFRTKRDDIMMSGCWPPKNASCYLPCWLPQQCFGTKDVMKPASLSTYMEQLKCQENADAKHQHWTLCKGFKDYISPFALPTYEISCVIIGSMCIVLLGSSKIEKLVTFFGWGTIRILGSFQTPSRVGAALVVMAEAEAAKSPKELVGCGKCGKSKKRTSYWVTMLVVEYVYI